MKISNEQRAEILTLLKQGNKIAAIKIFKEATGMGLKESKQFVDILAEGIDEIDDEYIEKLNNQKISIKDEDVEQDFAEIQKLLLQGKKIEAVKFVKEKGEISLKSAKTIVDKIEDNLIINDLEDFDKKEEIIEQKTEKSSLQKHKSNIYSKKKPEKKYGGGCMLTLSAIFLIGGGIFYLAYELINYFI